MTEPASTAAPSNGAAAPAQGSPAASAPADPPAYTPPATQADLDALIGRRLNQQRAQYGMTPEEVAALKSKVEAAEAANATDMEKAIAKAAKEAQEAADAQYRPQLAETAFRVLIGDRKSADEVNDFIADLNLSRFLTDSGQVDTAKVLARVEQFAPSKGTAAAPTTPAPRGPVVPGHSAAAPPVKVGDAAKAFLANNYGIKVGDK